MTKVIKKVLPLSIILAIFYFLIQSLINNISKIPSENIHFDFLKLLVSYLFLIFHFVIYIFSWKAIMGKLNVTVDFFKSFWMIATSQIAKYLPGGVWFAVGRIYLAKKEKMVGYHTAVSVILETCLIMISGIIIILILFIVKRFDYTFNIIFIIALLLLLLLLLHPKVLSLLVNIFLKTLKKGKIRIDITYWQIIKLSIYFFGFWIAQIIGFYFLINAIYPIAISKIFSLAAVYTLSWMTGFVVIFAPGGLGVREGMMTLLLLPILPAPLAIAISFIARIWITLFEIVIFFVGLLVKRLSNLKDNSQ
ncbi:flippase-like domain-containing protein [candidate division WOR-3 bacterium]|nr:flippase-like domain-containing protein [candidate division WOR-3 bacterium]